MIRLQLFFYYEMNLNIMKIFYYNIYFIKYNETDSIYTYSLATQKLSISYLAGLEFSIYTRHEIQLFTCLL